MKTPFPTTPCKGCGKLIIFAKNENGAILPLDLRPPLYVAYQAADGVLRCRQIKTHDHLYPCVTHFATCSHANEFSKKGKS